MDRNTIANLINGAVGAGPNASNNPNDVKIIEYLFNIIAIPVTTLPETGICNQSLISKIKRFQSQELRFTNPDGRIDPAGKTLKTLVSKAQLKRPMRTDLNNASRPYRFGGAWCGGTFSGELSSLMSFLGFKATQSAGKTSAGQAHRTIVDSYLKLSGPSATPQENQIRKTVTSTANSRTQLTASDYQAAASKLGSGISAAIVQAFAEVESGGRSGFGSSGLPVIAFEGHIFRKYTGKKYDSTHPKLSYKYVKKAGPEWKENNKDQKTAWKTLNAAMELDAAAAVKASSWGMFQVMGFNYSACGYDSVNSFVADMKAGEQGQLKAFVSFCKAVPGMVDAIKNKNFVKMATLYNGADYGDYDVRISKAYKKHGGS